MIIWIGRMLIGMVMTLYGQGRDDIGYFQSSTITLMGNTDLIERVIYDSLLDQQIYQVSTSHGIPMHYYMQLNTGVCFDNQCRPLSILVYWNITGRYLGFKLVDGEFLSKYDHEPFSVDEYKKLHQLLADPFLPLGEYAFEELVRDTTTMESPVDGVSGATSEDVLDYIVPGAAYTTYKLWNVVYGPIQQQVIQQTEKQLDAELFNKILESTDQSDITWALERIALIKELDEQTINLIADIIVEGEYFLAYLALRSLSQEQLDMDHLQKQLIRSLSKADQGVIDLILERLMHANTLGNRTIDESFSQIKSLNNTQLLSLLELYAHHQISDQRLCPILEESMASQNAFVKNQVLKYYDKLSCK